MSSPNTDQAAPAAPVADRHELPEAIKKHVWGGEPIPHLPQPVHEVGADMDRLWACARTTNCERRLIQWVREHTWEDWECDDRTTVTVAVDDRRLSQIWVMSRQRIKASLRALVASRMLLKEEGRYRLGVLPFEWGDDRISASDIEYCWYGDDYDPPAVEFKQKKPILDSIRTAVFERDSYRCQKCGDFKGLSADHVVPESKGGPTTIDNLQTLCRACNLSKGSKTIDYRPASGEGVGHVES